MLNALPPFYHENVEKMYEMIKHSDLKFSKRVNLSSDAKELITKLLERNPDKRLGRQNGFEEIKSMNFFNGVDFEGILNKTVEADFKPTISGSLDVHNFDSMFTSEEIQMTQISENTLKEIRKNQSLFEDFNK